MSKLKIAVFISGSGSNLQAIIDKIAEGYINGEIVLVLSDQPNAYGLVRAKKHRLPTAVVKKADYASREEYDLALAEFVKAAKAELVVLAGFMKLLSPVFIDKFPNQIVNIHPALLPAFPGLHVQQKAVDYGVKYSGCTVHFVDSGMDSGPIIGQAVVPVLPGDDGDVLAARILEQEHLLFPWVLKQIAENKVVIDGRKVIIKE